MRPPRTLRLPEQQERRLQGLHRPRREEKLPAQIEFWLNASKASFRLSFAFG